MSLNIPTSIKTEFKLGFAEYIKKMGRQVIIYLEPTIVDCPNCILDNVSKKSANVYNEFFKLPVNIFPGTVFQRVIYPQPFNVTSVSGVQYDPTNANPKILMTTVCPVCFGNGKLESPNSTCIIAVVTAGHNETAKRDQYFDTSAGRDGFMGTRLKTYECNLAVCREAIYYLIDGVKMKNEVPPKLKGLGNLAITECYLSMIEETDTTNTSFDQDQRLQNSVFGQASDPAPSGTPTIPPLVPGKDVW